MEKYTCAVCGYVHTVSADEWAEMPESWVCIMCGAPKSLFAGAEGEPAKADDSKYSTKNDDNSHQLRELGNGELSALFSGLGKACEKQNLPEEAGLFRQLADYYKAKTPLAENAGVEYIFSMAEEDISTAYPAAEAAGKGSADRGTLRAFTWGSKVSRIVSSLAGRWQKEGDAFIKGHSVFVCEICGFIYIGDEKPVVCPVCKVPSLKITELGKGA